MLYISEIVKFMLLESFFPLANVNVLDSLFTPFCLIFITSIYLFFPIYLFCIFWKGFGAIEIRLSKWTRYTNIYEVKLSNYSSEPNAFRIDLHCYFHYRESKRGSFSLRAPIAASIRWFMASSAADASADLITNSKERCIPYDLFHIILTRKMKNHWDSSPSYIVALRHRITRAEPCTTIRGTTTGSSVAITRQTLTEKPCGAHDYWRKPC